MVTFKTQPALGLDTQQSGQTQGSFEQDQAEFLRNCMDAPGWYAYGLRLEVMGDSYQIHLAGSGIREGFNSLLAVPPERCGVELLQFARGYRFKVYKPCNSPRCKAFSVWLQQNVGNVSVSNEMRCQSK